MTPRNYEIVDCGALCEVIFFCISPKSLLGDFFYSLSSYRAPRKKGAPARPLPNANTYKSTDAFKDKRQLIPTEIDRMIHP